MKSDNAHSVLDLFGAPGGLSEGFRQAGYRISAIVDKDKWGCKTLAENFSQDGTLIIQDDIASLDIRGNVDVVVGGPPCQGFSLVGRPKIRSVKFGEGKKRVVDKRNTLYKHFVRIVNSTQPQFFVMENVLGINSSRRGRLVQQILRDFRNIGYHTDILKLNAADFGVPQNRRRVFFIGNRSGLKNPIPIRTHQDYAKYLQPELGETGRLLYYLTVFDAISDLPPLEPGQGNDEIDYPRAKRLTDYQICARIGSPKLYNHVSRKHSERDRDLFRRLKQGEKMSDLPKNLRPYRDDIFKDKIKKQRWDKPSSAILAHMQKDGLMYIHPDTVQARSFTPREAARLQSFPDRFRFLGPMTQQFRQIGNSVPPLLARSIACSVMTMLEPPAPPTVIYKVLTA